MRNKLTERHLEQRRLAPLKHGGEAAVKAIQRGEELSGMAAEAEIDVYRELANTGRPSIVERNAARLQAAADLYWAAILGADNLVDLDKYIKRFGWLSTSALRAWAAVKDEEASAPGGDITELLGGGDHGD